MSYKDDLEFAHRLDLLAKEHTAVANRYGRDTDLAERRLAAAEEAQEQARELRRG